MPKYVKCPRCDLNYMLEGEEYCDVCKAELKKAPPLVFAVLNFVRAATEITLKAAKLFAKSV